MYGDKWWGYLGVNGVVVITPQDPRFCATTSVLGSAVKVVGPFAEDMADEFEGNQQMVRRRIIAAIYDKPLMDVEEEP